MRTRRNPIPKELQRPRRSVGGFAEDDDESEYQARQPLVLNWDRNCNGETYENFDLRHIYFVNASLVGTTFINCDLRECDFERSNLRNTTFKNCDLRYAQFIGFNMRTERGSIIADFEESDLRDAEFFEFTDYASAFNWNRVRMEGTRFDDVEFVKYVYDLHYSEIENPNLYIDGLPILSANDKDLRDFNFKNAKFLKGAILFDSNLQDMNLRGADLRGARLLDADLRGADLIDALYDDETEGLTKSQKSKMIYTP